MGIGVKIILAIIVLHLIAGFGFLFYKLTPRDEDNEKNEQDPINK